MYLAKYGHGPARCPDKNALLLDYVSNTLLLAYNKYITWMKALNIYLKRCAHLHTVSTKERDSWNKTRKSWIHISITISPFALSHLCYIPFISIKSNRTM